MRTVWLWLMCLLVALGTSATMLLGQAIGSGTITGRITDQRGAVISNANVPLTDISTQISQSVESNELGFYIFGKVKPGKYDISVIQPGFQKTVLSGQMVVGSMLTPNFTSNCISASV